MVIKYLCWNVNAIVITSDHPLTYNRVMANWKISTELWTGLWTGLGLDFRLDLLSEVNIQLIKLRLTISN